MASSKELVCGRYKHYKGKNYYIYGLAIDNNRQEYILYKAEYADGRFWIRPKKMFFSKVDTDSGRIDRFKKTGKNVDGKSALNELCNELDKGFKYITHSETEENYAVFAIKSKPTPIIYISNEIKPNSSAYLTDFQIALKMNWYMFSFDDNIHFSEAKENVDIERCLKISDPTDTDSSSKDVSILKKQLNPCSVDLRITDNFFYKTRHTKIDLTSINSIKTADKLWKKVRINRKNKNDYFKLKPGESIITHTFEKIKIPSDCAGKIEIKSTYARLSLSVTTADFCNPGWEGFFPLILRNDGKNTICLHPKESMLQIMLIPTNAPIVVEYEKKSTYMNDDGTPFKYWNAKTVDYQSRLIDDTSLKRFYNNLLSKYDDIDQKERIENTFLRYCEKRKNKTRFQDHENKLDLRKLYGHYIIRERRLKAFNALPSKIITSLSFIVSTILSILTWVVKDPSDWIKNNLYLIRTILISLGVTCGVLFICILLFSPKVFCTEKKEY